MITSMSVSSREGVSSDQWSNIWSAKDRHKKIFLSMKAKYESSSPTLKVTNNDYEMVNDLFQQIRREKIKLEKNDLDDLGISYLGSSEPAIALSSNNIYVVWTGNTNSNLEVLYRTSPDNGVTFPSVMTNLSGNVGDSTNPSIAISGNNVHVVWDDDTPGNQDIFYRRSIDGGSTFLNIIKNLSSNAGFSFDPAIAVSGSNIYVVWEDETPGYDDILYRTSANGGTTFPAVLTNLSD